MSYYAVFDTNVLVSALISKHSDSAVVLSLDILLAGDVTPLYNDEIISEYEDVLHRPHFQLPESLVIRLIEHIKKTGVKVESVRSGELFSDEDDRVFYEVALSNSESFLVTGNTKHFPKNPIVVTPLEFLSIIRKSK